MGILAKKKHGGFERLQAAALRHMGSA